MMRSTIPILALLYSWHSLAIGDQNTNQSVATFDEIIVTTSPTLIEQPAHGYQSIATQLRFNSLVELQTRGLAEGQSDVVIRGSVFENTGVKIGAVNIIDPQTGHYTGGLPISPRALTNVSILHDNENAISGFNANIATLAYDIKQISAGGQFTIGFGSDQLHFQSLNLADVISTSDQAKLGLGISVSRSQGDGSVEFGDHQFSRLNMQLQWRDKSTQTDLLLAYQDKFFGWPGAYTGFESLAETDDTETQLIVANQRRNLKDGWIEFGAYYRRLKDDYDFDRSTIESDQQGSFEHETKAYGFGLEGTHSTGKIDWRYFSQITGDELIHSTDLTGGDFSSRNYATFSLAPKLNHTLADGGKIEFTAGLRYDYSNRNSDKLSPLLGIILRRENDRDSIEYSLAYSATSQLPGYTALKSQPDGLFGGNPLLARETAKQLSAAVERRNNKWQMRFGVFARRDDQLVDWTFSTDAPFARQANPVKLDVIGVETWFRRSWPRFDLVLGYTALDKDADYANADVDASYYALNFAKQRASLALSYRIGPNIELRIDSEYRLQEKNPLRDGDEDNHLASLALLWSSEQYKGLDIAIIVDNLSNTEFQTFPGTPGSRRQFSLSTTYRW